jgi:hypothetical protein
MEAILPRRVSDGFVCWVLWHSPYYGVALENNVESTPHTTCPVLAGRPGSETLATKL